MNQEQFEATPFITAYCKSCLKNMYQGGDTYKELWEKAHTFSEFKELVKTDDRVRLKKGTVELLKTDVDYYKYLNSILGEKRIDLSSDAGGVKVGNDMFSFIIPNGYGDGTTKFAVLEPEEMNRDAFTYLTVIQGEFNVYKYDCGNEIATTLEGRYGIFYGSGFVVFESWGKVLIGD